MKGKKVSDSQIHMMELVQPNDANNLGNMLGGKVMHLIDIAAAMSGLRHCRKPVVTASVDSLDFRHPIKVGNMIILRASVNFTHKTSMEIGVRVESENPLTGERFHTSSAYLTFVALDENGKPAEIPGVIPETDMEKRRYEAAIKRRELRMKARSEINSRNVN